MVGDYDAYRNSKPAGIVIMMTTGTVNLQVWLVIMMTTGTVYQKQQQQHPEPLCGTNRVFKYISSFC